MVQLIKMLLEKLYGILPDSPFQEMFKSVDMSFGDIIPYLNWFVPFDLCFKVMSVWVGCIAAYYVFNIARKLIFDIIIPHVFSGISIGTGIFGK